MSVDTIEALPGIDRIRGRFLDLLEDRMTLIERLSHDFENAAAARKGLGEAQMILHKIAGTAGTLGFGRLGDTARNCEEQIITHLQDGTPGMDEIFRDLADFTVQAEALIRR